MALNYADLAVKAGETANADFFNRRYQLIVNEIAAAEAMASTYGTTSQELLQLGLTQINGVLGPLLVEIQAAATLGFLTAASTSSVILFPGDGASFVIPLSAVNLFAPTPFLSIQDAANSGNWAVATLASWNKVTGALNVNIVETSSGSTLTGANWIIAAGSAILPAAQAAMTAAAASASAASASASTASAAASSATASAATLAAAVASGPVASVAGLTGSISAASLKTALAYSIGNVAGLGTGVATALGNTAGASGGFALFSSLGTGAFSPAYSLPLATSSTLGGVKPDGTTLTNASGALSVTYGAAAGTAAQGNDARITGALQTTALGTGVLAALGNAPNAASGVVQLNSSGQLPAVSGALLTGISGLPPLFFGDGSDGSVTVSSGVTTLTRDMYYANLTLSGAGRINAAGWRIFVSGTLNIAAAGAGAIYTFGANGNAASPSFPGAAQIFAATTLDCGQTSGDGGFNGNGNAAAPSYALGGLGGLGGGIPSFLLSGGAQTGVATPPQRSIKTHIDLGPLPWTGGGPGSGGAGNSFGGGGANGAPVLMICAATINRGSSTAVGAISAAGGIGGTAIGGGGGCGGGGGGGGFICILYGALIGSTATNALSAPGGGGGVGVVNSGGERGGQGGGGGKILIANASAATIAVTSGTTGATSSTTAGGVAGTCTASL